MFSLFRSLRGTSQVKAIEEFLYCSYQLSNYGFEIHKNLKIGQTPTEIAVDASGILIKSRVKLKWSQIAEFRYRESKFTLSTKTKDKVILISAASTHKGKVISKVSSTTFCQDFPEVVGTDFYNGLFLARCLFLSMTENHQFHRPESKSKKSGRSGMKDLTSGIDHLIGQIRVKSPFNINRNSPKPAKPVKARHSSSIDTVDGNEKKERRKSAPPKADNIIEV